jgi:hypothetical protein
MLKVGFLLLSALSFKVRCHSVTRQCHAKLHIDLLKIKLFTVLHSCIIYPPD